MATPLIFPQSSDYCYQNQPMFVETTRAPSDYVLNTGMSQQERLREDQLRMEQVAAQRIPSEYMSTALRNAEAKGACESVIQQKTVGYPISGRELKNKLQYLDDAIYQPTMVNGTLFFVAAEADVRTARQSTSFDQPTSAVDTAVEVPSSESFFNRNIAPSLTVPLVALANSLDADTYQCVLNAYLNEVSSGRVRLSPREAADLTRLVSGSRPSESTRTAAEFSSSTYLADRNRRPTSFMQTGAQKSNSAVTAMSQSMCTGAELSAPAHTGRTNSDYTGAELSAPSRTARTNSYYTGAEASDPARTAMSRSYNTGAEVSSPCRTAASRSIITAAQASDPCRTAASRSMITGAQRSDSGRTARSESLYTGAQKSDSCNTARRTRSCRSNSGARLPAGRDGHDADECASCDVTTAQN